MPDAARSPLAAPVSGGPASGGPASAHPVSGRRASDGRASISPAMSVSPASLTTASGLAPAPRDWTPPWPPIQIATSEWILMRDDRRTPAAVVRALRLGAPHELFYRVVAWAPTSENRVLIGYFCTLAEADRAVLFMPDLPGSRMQPVRG